DGPLVDHGAAAVHHAPARDRHAAVVGQGHAVGQVDAAAQGRHAVDDQRPIDVDVAGAQVRRTVGVHRAAAAQAAVEADVQEAGDVDVRLAAQGGAAPQRQVVEVERAEQRGAGEIGRVVVDFQVAAGQVHAAAEAHRALHRRAGRVVAPRDHGGTALEQHAGRIE